MEKNAPIVFLDSGIGGLPYLEWMLNELPEESYIYVADRKNFPYGERETDELITLVIAAVEQIVNELKPKLIVVACNTASVAALAKLRDRFKIPFVGVVPALKPAAERSNYRRIGLLATSRTVADAYTDRLINDYASDCRVTRVGNPNIVDFIEKYFLNSSRDERQKLLDDTVRQFKDANIDFLVIGCTHFIFIEDDLRKALGPAVDIIDSREGVGRQVIRMLEKLNLRNRNHGSRSLYVTSLEKEPDRYRDFSRMYGLSFKGLLKDSAR